MDVRAENRGRPHQKVRFSAAPPMGRNFLTQGCPGVRVRNVRGKSGPKSLCLCCFSCLIRAQSGIGVRAKYDAELPPFIPLPGSTRDSTADPLRHPCLRSCRSSSVNFFGFFAGKFGKFSGKFGGNFRDFFLTHRTKAQTFRGKFRSIFRKKIRSSKKIFRANFTLQTCHLNH